MNMARPILKNIPIPKTRRAPKPPPRRKWPLDQMEVGDMFFVPGRDKNNLSTYCSTASRKLGREFTTKLTLMVGSDEVGWQPADDETLGAVLGIGVWRTK